MRLAALIASRGLLPMLGLAPIAGRTFTVAEDRAKGPKVALISESLWTRSFGRAPQAIGGTIRLDEEPYTVVGVMPDQADFGMLQILGAADYSRGYADRGDRATADVWLPLQADVEALPRSTHPILLVGRLAPGASVSSAQTELTRLSAALERAYRENDGRGAFVEPLDAVVFGPARPALLMLWGAVGLVLLIGCVNVANLLLDPRPRPRRARSRCGWRSARACRRLARQFLLENLVLTLAAPRSASCWPSRRSRALLALAPPSVPRLEAVALDLRVLGLTLGLAMVTGLVFGLVPLLQAWRLDPQATLKSEGLHGASTGRSRRRTQRVLVVERAGAGRHAASSARRYWSAASRTSCSVDAGLPHDRRDQGRVPASGQPLSRGLQQVAEPGRDPRVHRRACCSARRSCQASTRWPCRARIRSIRASPTRSRSSAARPSRRNWPELSIRSVTPGYFRVIGLPLSRGRLLARRRHDDGDAGAGDQPGGRGAVLRGPRAARRADPVLGRDLDDRRRGGQREIPRRHRGRPHRGLCAAGAGADARHRRAAGARGRRSGDAGAGHRRAWSARSIPALAVFGVEPLDDTLLRSVGQRRFAMILLTLFAGLALVLAVIGVHGVLSYGVTERRRELGIRVALGAAARQITWLVVREGLLLTAAGIAVGIAGALIASRALSSLLFGVGATDATTYVVVAAALARRRVDRDAAARPPRHPDRSRAVAARLTERTSVRRT